MRSDRKRSRNIVPKSSVIIRSLDPEPFGGRGHRDLPSTFAHILPLSISGRARVAHSSRHVERVEHDRVLDELFDLDVAEPELPQDLA